MKFTAITTFALCAAVATAADSSLDVASVLSDFYTTLPTIPAAASTSLASALNSVQSTWLDSPAWTTARDAIYSAAPSSVQVSIDKSGYGYDEIMTQTWYTKSVPTAVQTAIKNEIAAIQSAAAKVVGTPSTSKGGAAPMRTAAPMVVLGGAAVVGGLVAAF